MTCTLAILCGPEANSRIVGQGVDHLRPLLEQPLFDQLLLCCWDTKAFRGLGTSLVADLFPGLGPLAGIHAALAASPSSEQVMALSCSDPWPLLPSLRRLAEHPLGPLVVLLGDQLPAPLPGRYSRRCLKQLRHALLAGRPELPSMIKTLHPAFCSVEPRRSTEP